MENADWKSLHAEHSGAKFLSASATKAALEHGESPTTIRRDSRQMMCR